MTGSYSGGAEQVDDVHRAELTAARDRIRSAFLNPRDERPPSSARGVHHVALICSDVERTTRFYQEVLGFPLTTMFENRDLPGSTHFFFDLGNGNTIAYFGVMTFFAKAVRERNDDAYILQRIDTAHRDIASLMEHMRFLSSRIMFLLDATLGMINIEQNQIIKIFSVLAVVLLPPTLVGTIYGMNFKHMPELDWVLGYPWALGLMVISAVLPFAYFRRRGWL